MAQGGSGTSGAGRNPRSCAEGFAGGQLAGRQRRPGLPVVVFRLQPVHLAHHRGRDEVGEAAVAFLRAGPVVGRPGPAGVGDVLVEPDLGADPSSRPWSVTAGSAMRKLDEDRPGPCSATTTPPRLISANRTCT